jgi:hypothetical protein
VRDLFSKRWIVLETPTTPGTPCIDLMLLDYETARAERERVWLRLRGQSPSEWQRQTCPQETAFVSQ